MLSWVGLPLCCRVGDLAHEVGIGIPIADAAQRGAARGDTTATDAEQGLVRQDVPAGEQAQFLTGQDLAPAPAHGQEHLTHVDLGAEAVVWIPPPHCTSGAKPK